MKRWNLSNFDQFEQPILQRNTVVESNRDFVRKSSVRSTSLKMMIGVAALTATTLIITATGSSKTLIVPDAHTVVAANASVDEPPLEKAFAGRF